METLKLELKKREATGRQAKTVRAESFIPGVIYGFETDNKNVSVPYNEFAKVYKEGGESSLIDITVDGGEVIKAMIKAVQRHYLSDRFIHFDFYKVDLKKKVTASVELIFIGESAAVKELGGSLIKSKSNVEIECLPMNLVKNIEVDLSKIADFDDMLHVSDLVVPEGVEILDDPSNTVVSVTAPKSEEELKAEEEAEAAATSDVGDVKTEADEKKEEKTAEAEGEAETKDKK